MENFDGSNDITGGLTTKQSLLKLHKDVQEFLDDLKPQLRNLHLWKNILNTFSRKRAQSTFRWTSIILLICSIITYIIAYLYGHFTSSLPLAIEIVILILVLILNITITYWNDRSRHMELYKKALKLAKNIGECANNDDLMRKWSTHVFYVNLNTPTSPCITLQWTYRDGELINLPVSLLVKGDVILLGPGRRAPADCRRIVRIIKRKKTFHDYASFDEKIDQPDQSAQTNHVYNYVFCDNDDTIKECKLNRGDIFAPIFNDGLEPFTKGRIRKSLKPSKFLLIETPYVTDLKSTLTSLMDQRSATDFEKELKLIFVRYIEFFIVPAIFFLVLIFSVVHYCYVEFSVNSFDTGAATIALILLRPIMAILPMLPLALPLLWVLLNVYGLIKLDVVHENFYHNEDKILRSNKSMETFTEHDHSININMTDCSPSHVNTAIQKENNLLEEIDPDKVDLKQLGNMMLVRIFEEFFMFFYNDNGNLWRSANLLHTLGGMTALACVDKKGILSWPNPIVDKVFFLAPNRRKNDLEMTEMTKENRDGADIGKMEKEKILSNRHHMRRETGSKRQSILPGITRAECVQLDITLDRRTAYGLQFDDIYWNRYLTNLKPLGLAILLNTCNRVTHEEFVRFSDHIACESLKNEVAVPVVSKRCLCELARQIGFKENAIKGYEYSYQVGVFRHIRPEVIQRGKLAKSLNFPRLRMPFPNMTCAVIKDTFSNTSQLFSQGTGDLILDACAEYWNGENLALLTDYERKKILDFYQRSSLTSYCCSFAYIPLINENDQTDSLEYANFFKDHYIELPPESANLHLSMRSLDFHSDTPYHPTGGKFDKQQSSDNTSLFLNLGDVRPHHLSTDSIMEHECHLHKVDDNEQTATLDNQRLFGDNGDQNKQQEEEDDADDNDQDQDPDPNKILRQTLNKVTNEVFIGMTTLQYQACADFVRLVEMLDAACIRFVHFSKENELRSRVFSEKMGLESGWNCHISLLNASPADSGYGGSGGKEFDDNSKSNNKQNNNDGDNVKSRINNHRLSISSSSTEPSDSSSSDEDIVESPKRRRKQNSLCSERSEINGRFRPKEFRSSSKASGGCNSNQHRNMSPSPSRQTTTSTMTDDHSAPIAFDMSNRAKLPKGIENIRPHLESVDNVPLLVSLFTDCTPEATLEMIRVMQEYGEAVCVFGSMANESNIPIFLQANASIGVDPMYPHVCMMEPIRPIDELPSPNEFEGIPTPIQLANEMVSLPCSMTMQRHNAIIFYYLILFARDFMMRMRNVLQFFLSSCLSLSLAQVIASMLFLPPLFSPGIVLWLSLIVLPFLSVSLMGINPDSSVMNVATGKKLQLTKDTIIYFFVCYLIKFLPSMCICVLMFAIIIATSCEQTKVGRSTMGPCWMFSDVKADGDIKADLIWSSHLLIGQTIASFFLVLYLVLISIGFVHRNHLPWQRCPLVNYCWLATSIILIVCHLIVCSLEIYIYVPEAEITEHFIHIIPFYIWIIGFSWPLLLISVNVYTKRKEIKINNRQQRRARLDFGTKLGMNSPF